MTSEVGAFEARGFGYETIESLSFDGDFFAGPTGPTLGGKFITAMMKDTSQNLSFATDKLAPIDMRDKAINSLLIDAALTAVPAVAGGVWKLGNKFRHGKIFDEAIDSGKMANVGGTVPNTTKLLQTRTAETVNEAMIAAGNKPAWLKGTQVNTEIVPSGTRYQMVVSEGQAQALMEGKPAFGGFATPENIPSQAFARNKLVILEEFKPDVSYVITAETTAAQKLNSGFTGPLRNYSGGVRQVEFLDQRNLKMIGQPKPLPWE